MPGRRRGRTGRGWDAAPARPRTPKPTRPGQPADGDQPVRDPSGAAPPVRDPGQQARDICLRLLAVRPRTRAELAIALRQHGVDDEVADRVLDRYHEVGIIDDATFAQAWVTSRHHGRGLARRNLAGELRRKGVDGELIDAALEELDPDTEAATARALVDRKLRAARTGPPDAVFRRLVGMLARKGYPAGLAIRVVKQALADREGELAAFAEIVDPDAVGDLVGDEDDPVR